MISGILLAAGSSKRMGETNKLLLEYDKYSMVQKVVKEYLKSNLSEIILVIGYQDELIIKELAGYPIVFIFNKHHLSGMTSSIQCGLSILGKNNIGFLIGTTDTPGISSKHINTLIETFTINQTKKVVRSQLKNQLTHPTIFPIKYKNPLLNCKEQDGCRSIINREENRILSVSNQPSILYDIDSPEDEAIWKSL